LRFSLLLISKGGDPAKFMRPTRVCGPEPASIAALRHSHPQTGATGMTTSGPIRQLYGVVLRDKCKTADLATLKAYKVVAAKPAKK
jgi:hypothetical protein